MHLLWMNDSVYYSTTAPPRYSDISLKTMLLKVLFFNRGRDSDPARYGKRRAPERVSLYHYHSKRIKWLSPSTNQKSLYRGFSGTSICSSMGVV